ncbi:DUF6518 family protein [Dactylosporangium sp. CA-052675]|uniref:DUF6518 family protein n=1 Tax=Dactylosporangium sp. CA-052675 TaxID=3239927 RepID=UPI003D91C6AF
MRTLLAWTAGGIALGVVSLMLNHVLPGGSSRLVNSGAVWAAGAFAAGAAVRAGWWRVWLAGTVVLVGAVAGYYGGLVVFEGRHAGADVLAGPLGWGAVGLLAGPVFATAGAWWRDERRGRRVVGVCVLGGVFLAEAAYLAVKERPAGEAWIVAAIGLAVPLVLSRTGRERLLALVALVPAAVLGAMAYLALGSVLDVAFTR